MNNESAKRERISNARHRALQRLLANQPGFSSRERIEPRAHGIEPPLSFAQELIWLFERAHPGSCAYNSAVTLRLEGPFDLAAFGAAVTALATRHEALRTVLRESSEGEVRLRPLAPATVPIAVHDFAELPVADREPAALAALATVARTPFSLTTEAPFRVAVARVGEKSWLLLLLTHHIATDAWSYAIMLRELAHLYEAELAPQTEALPPVELQFGDFAIWQRATARGDRLERGLAYWRERLAQTPVLELPADRPRPASTDFAGASCAHVVQAPQLAGLRAVCSRAGTTMYAILLAAFSSLLHRYSGQDDIVVGSAVAGRPLHETENIVGYFSQALPMRTRFDGDPQFDALTSQVRGGIVEALEHQEVPFESLADAAAGENRADAPLFGVVLTMQDALAVPARFGQAAAAIVPLDVGATKFDLTLLATEHADRLELSLWYRTELFDATTARRLLANFGHLLQSVASDPTQRVSQLALHGDAEIARFEAWNADAARPRALAPVSAQISAATRRDPAALALVCGERRLSYGELEAEVAALARQLRQAGAQAGTLVGIGLDSSVEAIVALLAVLRARGAYVPLALDGPRARREQQIAAARLRFIVTSRSLADQFAGDGRIIVCLDRNAIVSDETLSEAHETSDALDDLAYVVFTSGTTGTPKGVAVTQRNIAHYTAAISDRLGLGTEALRFATVSSLGADLGNTAIFPALCTGGSLHILPRDVTTDPSRFVSALTDQPVDILKITPSHFGALLAGGLAAAALPNRWLILGGEACPWALARDVAETGRCRVLNHYGPTETTVGACTFAVGERDLGNAYTASVPVGLPLANVRTYVLDRYGRHVPLGVPGELYLGGPGVAAGYLYRDDLTAERFLADPFAAEPAARMYRTGDRVRRLATGDLEFLGRFDAQVKIRGHRVELGEIEAALLTDPAIAQAIVVLAQGEPGQTRLVGYVVPRAPGISEPNLTGRLTTALKEQLPDHMLPEALVVLERLPLTANGKIDRAALPDPEERRSAEAVAPRTPTEAAIAALWTEVFTREKVGVHDDFLAIGGHSILAIRLLGKLNRRFGVKLTLREFFEYATVARLAKIVEATTMEASGT